MCKIFVLTKKNKIEPFIFLLVKESCRMQNLGRVREEKGKELVGNVLSSGDGFFW